MRHVLRTMVEAEGREAYGLCRVGDLRPEYELLPTRVWIGEVEVPLSVVHFDVLVRSPVPLPARYQDLSRPERERLRAALAPGFRRLLDRFERRRVTDA